MKQQPPSAQGQWVMQRSSSTLGWGFRVMQLFKVTHALMRSPMLAPGRKPIKLTGWPS